MRIVFTGAAGTGKSTLVDILKEEMPNLPVFDSIVRNLGNYDRNEKDPYLVKKRQGMYNRQYVWKHLITPSYLSARSIYDTIAYSRINVDHKYYRYFFQVAVEVVKYDCVFYTPIEFEVEDDGYRPVDKEYNRNFDRELVTVLNFYRIPYITLTGSVEERLSIIREYV